jgi:uncharacterized damage-inducible protein DinB
MNTSELLLLQYHTLQRHFNFTSQDLNDGQMNWKPSSDANSISFLLWHVLRTWDTYYSMLVSCPELYEAGHWPEKFGFDVSGRGIEGITIGTGFTSEDVTVVKAKPEVLAAYFDALFEVLSGYLESATEQDLGQEFIVPWWPNPSTVAGVLTHILTHGMEHIGQAQYVRGLLPGKI